MRWTYLPADYQQIADGQADLYATAARARRRRRAPRPPAGEQPADGEHQDRDEQVPR